MVKNIISSLAIITFFFLSVGCSTTNQNVKPMKKESYEVGNRSAVHKLEFVDRHRTSNITRDVSFYFDGFPYRRTFDLCVENPKYVDKVAKLSQDPKMIYVNNGDDICKSYIVVQKYKNELKIDYQLNFYTTMKSIMSKDAAESKLPVTYSREGTNVFVDLSKRDQDASDSYWKLIY